MVNASFLPRPPSLLDPFGQPDQMNRASLLEPQRQRMLAKTRTQRWINSLSPSEKYAMGFDMPQRPPSMPDPRFDPADPNIASRGTILPIGRTKSGEEVWTVPQLALDMFSSAQLPGAVTRGYNPTFQDAAQMSMDTMMSGGLLGRAPAGALGANVWHGTPHKWAPEPDFPQGRPRLDKIGTGEGAQAYGYGIYSAEAKGVAKSYKDDLGGFDQLTLHTKAGKKAGDALDDVDLEVAKYLEFGAKDAGQFPHNTVYYAKKNAEKAGDKAALKRLDEYGPDARMSYERNYGSLYKLDLPDEDIAKMLDWDAPLSGQPKNVLDALPELRETINAGRAERFGPGGTLISEDKFMKMTGEDLQDHLAVTFGKSDEAASEALRKAGIPGLKYYDQGSRPVGGYPNAQGTAARLLDSAGGDVQKAIELAKTRIKAGNMPDVPDSGLRQAIKYLEEVGEPRTRNYVTWDQDVLDRAKVLVD